MKKPKNLVNSSLCGRLSCRTFSSSILEETSVSKVTSFTLLSGWCCFPSGSSLCRVMIYLKADSPSLHHTGNNSISLLIPSPLFISLLEYASFLHYYGQDSMCCRSASLEHSIHYIHERTIVQN